MSFQSIATGVANDLLNVNSSLRLERMAICKPCPAFKDRKYGSPVCNTKVKVMNEDLGHEVNGCGCLLNAKTRVKDEYCPAGKW